MQWLVEIGLSNAVFAVVLALVAFAVGAIARRPAVTHALCVLVLLKLLTPPIIELPVPLPIGRAAVDARVVGASMETPEVRDAAVPATESSTLSARSGRRRAARASAAPDSAAVGGARDSVPQRTRHVSPSESRGSGEKRAGAVAPVAARAGRGAREKGPASVSRQTASTNATAGRQQQDAHYWWTLLGRLLIGLWLVGTAVWCCLQAVLGLRLRAVLRRCTPAPLDVRKTALRLARHMGLKRCPPVLAAAATTAPMLCGLGRRTCIVLPAKLVRRLSPEARAAVLSHELAHYRRGDQWVRLVELIASGLYWWHPVVWWVRRQLETTEEQCCDAHVLAECGGGPRAYAEAILDVVDFVSGPAAPVRPVMSSGIRQRPLLKRRLTDLMEGNCVPNIAPGARRLIVIAGALCLSCHPTIFVTPAATARATSAARETPLRDRTAADDRRRVIEPSPLPGAAAAPAPEGTPASQSPWPFDSALTPLREVWATAVSSNGRYQVSVRPGYACELREVVNSHVRELTGHRIICVAFSPDSLRFVSGDRDGTVRLWDAASGSLLDVLQRRQGPVYSVAYSPVGDALAVAGEDGAVHVLNLDSPHQDMRIVRVGAPVRCVRFSPRGRRLAIAVDTWRESNGGRLGLYDLHSQTFVRQWRTDAPLGAVHFPSHDDVLAADWSGRVLRCSVDRPFGTHVTAVAKELVSTASFSPDTRAFEALVEEMESVFTKEQEADDRI